MSLDELKHYVYVRTVCKEIPTSSYISHSMFNPCLEYSTGQCVQSVWSAPLNSMFRASASQPWHKHARNEKERQLCLYTS